MRELQVMLGATPCHNRFQKAKGLCFRKIHTKYVGVPIIDQHLRPHTNKQTDRKDKLRQDPDQLWYM